MQDRLEQLLANSFEKSNFENFNADDVAASVAKLPAHHRKAIHHAIKQANGMTKSFSGGSPQDAVAGLIAESKGDLNLTVTRNGVNINAPLPFVLFGLNDFTANYVNTLQNLLLQIGIPTVSVAISTSAIGNVIFTYTNSIGPVSDTVTVANIGNISYKGFLSSMNQNYFSTKFAEISISDPTQNLQQFSQPLFYGLLSALGSVNNNQLVFRSRIFSWYFRSDKVELFMPEQKITPDFSFAMSIIKADGFSIGFDFFMSQRFNMNNSVQ